MDKLLKEIEAFASEFGLSDHRVGILLANNGRLVERLRNGRRIWPDTKSMIRKNMRTERSKRATSKVAS